MPVLELTGCPSQNSHVMWFIRGGGEHKLFENSWKMYSCEQKRFNLQNHERWSKDEGPSLSGCVQILSIGMWCHSLHSSINIDPLALERFSYNFRFYGVIVIVSGEMRVSVRVWVWWNCYIDVLRASSLPLAFFVKSLLNKLYYALIKSPVPLQWVKNCLPPQVSTYWLESQLALQIGPKHCFSHINPLH